MGQIMQMVGIQAGDGGAIPQVSAPQISYPYLQLSKENRILEVVKVLVQPLHLTDGKIRHWSKSPRVTVAKPCLLPRFPDFKQALSLPLDDCSFSPTHFFLVLWQKADNPHSSLSSALVQPKYLFGVQHYSVCWGHSRKGDRQGDKSQ